ncbi:hypothetical protein PV797_14545 [Clostridiaceae bacterium M8S5]|nr:hypothetical protein PV797_14545 [Clostridiaceae bacterium M8S5]
MYDRPGVFKISMVRMLQQKFVTDEILNVRVYNQCSRNVTATRM